MTDIALLAQQAMTALGPLLPYAAGNVTIGFLRRPGAELYDWLASKVKGTPAGAALESAVAEPENQRRLDILRLQIEEMAEKDTEFREQLAGILKGIGTAQTATQTGDNSTIVQAAGNNISIQAGRSSS